MLIEGDLGSIWTAHVGPTAAPHELTTQINTQWTNREGDYFGLNFHHDDAMVTGFTKTVRPETLAHVHATFGATVPGRSGLRYAVPYPRFGEGPGAWTVLLPVKLPGERDEYYTTEGNSWSSSLDILAENNIDTEAALIGPVKSYQPGRTYEESFNRGVFGPVMPKTHNASLYVTRTENKISVNIPLSVTAPATPEAPLRTKQRRCFTATARRSARRRTRVPARSTSLPRPGTTC